ncbi:MAG: hypothetical protein SPL71_11500 [Oribacterium sp.]|jgi:hypothetical protein|nr:hypothetical protein [Oribacterium sp.]
MKKILYAAILSAAVVSLAACGSKSSDSGAKDNSASTETTEASDNGQADAAETTSLDDSTDGPVDTTDLGSSDCTVQKLEGNNLTVELDDGSSMTFDISEAYVNPAWQLMTGDEVNVYFEGEEPTDGMKVLEVAMAVPYEYTSESYDEDPQVYGEVTAVSADSISVVENEGREPEEGGPVDGTEYTFKRPSYETVVGDPKVGDSVQVLYLGDLTNAISYRICTEAMMDDPKSDIYEIQGTLAQFKAGIIYLKTDEGDVFGFNPDGDEKLIAEAKKDVGKKVRISYTDSIRMRVSSCDGITVVE